MKRIIALGWFLAAATALLGGALPRTKAVEVNLDYVAKLAEARARKPFHSPKADLPDFLRNLSYDSYREIEFRHDKALWADGKSPFRVEFFSIPATFTSEPVYCKRIHPRLTPSPSALCRIILITGSCKCPRRFPPAPATPASACCIR